MSRAARGRALSLIFSTLLLGRAIAVRGHTEVRVELQLERWSVRGGSVRLRCVHDVPPHLLDKVVFLRHGTKIFQYIKDRKPPYRNFTTPGAVLNIALATENSIILQNLDFAASGSYSCEVSLDTPIFTKASTEKQLTVIQPQKHQPSIQFPRRRLVAGETLRANCTSAPALPAPHITWIVNGNKVDESMVHSHKFRVPTSDRWSMRRGHNHHEPATRPEGHRARGAEPEGRQDVHTAVTAAFEGVRRPLSGLTTPSEYPPGCSVLDMQMVELSEGGELGVLRAPSRHRSRRPGRELYVTVSELQLVATGRLDIACVSTIPEFRSIHDTFADVRNDTVVVEIIKPSTLMQPSENLTLLPTEVETGGAGGARSFCPVRITLATALASLFRLQM